MENRKKGQIKLSKYRVALLDAQTAEAWLVKWINKEVDRAGKAKDLKDKLLVGGRLTTLHRVLNYIQQKSLKSNK